MTKTNLDTDKTHRIIMNDEGLYNLAMELSCRSYCIADLAEEMGDKFTGIIKTDPYNDINFDNVDWKEIATEIMR